MRSFRLCALACVSLAGTLPFFLVGHSQQPNELPAATVYLGFDRNIYPGDEAIPVLRKTFSFTSFWLGAPPGEKRNSWQGKRELLASQGFGFVVLFKAMESRKLKSAFFANHMGFFDADYAAKLARGEGFPDGTVIFLDIEEGGRLPTTYHEYVGSWIETLEAASFRAGVYCSAMPVDEGGGVSITTAQDLKNHLGARQLKYWVYNDACPPSPGCSFSLDALPSAGSGFANAIVCQYAQSPRRKEFTAHCPAKYAADGNCYAPGDSAHKWFLDANVASSADPSGGR